MRSPDSPGRRTHASQAWPRSPRSWPAAFSAVPFAPAALALVLVLAALLAWSPPEAPAQQPATVYHGNVRSRIYHRPGCRYYDCRMCVVTFTTKQQAEAAGYRGCKVCRP